VQEAALRVDDGDAARAVDRRLPGGVRELGDGRDHDRRLVHQRGERGVVAGGEEPLDRHDPDEPVAVADGQVGPGRGEAREARAPVGGPRRDLRAGRGLCGKGGERGHGTKKAAGGTQGSPPAAG